MRRAGPPAWLAAAALSVAVIPGPACAQGQSLTLVTRLGSYYDDNILQYSRAQILDFEQSIHPDRFALETRDDVLIVPGLGLVWLMDRGGGRRHELRVEVEGDFHGKNGTADYREFSIGARELWSRDRRLSLSYYRIPGFYLRQLLDEDFVPAYPGLSRYRRADFVLDIASVNWTLPVRPGLLGHLHYQYEHRNYNDDFNERDSNLHQVETGLTWTRLPHRASLGVRGGYRVSGARAEDGDEPEAIPDVDVSFHGFNASLGGRMEIARSGRARFFGDLGWALETRQYESDRPTDRYHFGRDDLLNVFEVGLAAAYRPHWTVRGFYRLEDNSAHLGTAAPLSADTGSYRANQVGLSLEWSGRIWTRAAADEGEGETP